MEVQNIIHQVTAAGLKIGYRNDKITISPRTKITSSIRQQVKTNKPAIILAIRNAPARLVHLAITAGIHEQGYLFSTAEIRKLQREIDLQDCINCNRQELQAWASALAIRATRQRGKVPNE